MGAQILEELIFELDMNWVRAWQVEGTDAETQSQRPADIQKG